MLPEIICYIVVLKVLKEKLLLEKLVVFSVVGTSVNL